MGYHVLLPYLFTRSADNSDSYTGSDDDDILLDSDRYIAVTNYTRQAQDELSVSEGQVVYVVDDSDKSKSRSHLLRTWRHTRFKKPPVFDGEIRHYSTCACTSFTTVCIIQLQWYSSAFFILCACVSCS